jgi:hypothetical protein
MQLDRGREGILEALSLNFQGTAEKPTPHFKTNFLEKVGTFNHSWEALLAQLRGVPEVMKGKIAHLPWLQIHRPLHLGLSEMLNFPQER